MLRILTPLLLTLGCAPDSRLDAASGSSAEKGDKLTICHATSSETNPYTIISVSQSSWDSGHGDHEGDFLLPVWFADSDGDGFGDADSPYGGESCTAPSGYVPDPTDCDDLDDASYPGAEEICDDGLDNSCDGEVDEDCVDCESQLLGNASFEEPVIAPYAYQKHATGSTLGDWTVGGTSVDIVGPSYGAYDGDQSIDMAGTPGPGSLYQSIDTAPGQDYTISFAVSSNGGAKTESLALEWDGVEVLLVDSPAAGSWDTHTVTVTATGTSSLVEFRGTLGGNAGALLDAIEMYAECD